MRDDAVGVDVDVDGGVVDGEVGEEGPESGEAGTATVLFKIRRIRHGGFRVVSATFPLLAFKSQFDCLYPIWRESCS